MRRLVILLGAAALTSCDSAPETAPANKPSANVAESAAAPSAAPRKKKRPAFCFFKDAETSGWSASRDRAGNVVVKGRAFRSDPRYKAELGPPEIDGNTALISPTIVQNGGYASPDNWWDVSATLPGSREVEVVKVECGPKTLAELGIAPAR